MPESACAQGEGNRKSRQHTLDCPQTLALDPCQRSLGQISRRENSPGTLKMRHQLLTVREGGGPPFWVGFLREAREKCLSTGHYLSQR